jgi:RHS repeat-associated protein
MDVESLIGKRQSPSVIRWISSLVLVFVFACANVVSAYGPSSAHWKKISAGTTNTTDWLYNASGLRTRQIDRVNLGVATTNFFLWDGMELCEQRSGSNGGTVDKRFFGMGVQRVTGSDTGKFFYTFDHLGSIRELIDSSQVVRGRWDYGPWGDPSANLITSSAVDSDFKYTGHYHHATSGLILAPMRPYDPVLERWLTDDFLEWADPFQPQRYTLNDPIGLTDPLGLDVGASGRDASEFYYYGNMASPVLKSSISPWLIPFYEAFAPMAGFEPLDLMPMGAGVKILKSLPCQLAPRGLITPGKYFGSKTAQEVSEALTKKFGPPKSIRDGAETFYNPKTKRSFNVHTDPAHGPPHVDVRRRGGYPEQKYPLAGGQP